MSAQERGAPIDDFGRRSVEACKLSSYLAHPSAEEGTGGGQPEGAQLEQNHSKLHPAMLKTILPDGILVAI
jgi:hypothetical protein